MSVVGARDTWNALYHDSLQEFMSESELLRDLSMLLCVLQLKYEEVKRVMYENEAKIKETNENKFRACECGKDKSLLQITEIIDRSVNNSSTSNDISKLDISEGTPLKTTNTLDLLDDMFNQQISEIDIEALQDTSNNEVVNDTFAELETNSSSPKLNKTKRLSRALKLKICKNLTPDEPQRTNVVTPKNKKENKDTLVCSTPDTPDIFIMKSKKGNLSTLFGTTCKKGDVLKNILQNSQDTVQENIKEESAAEKSRLPEKRPHDEDDDDETMCFAAPNKTSILVSPEKEDFHFEIPLNNKSLLKTSLNHSKKVKTSMKENVLNLSYDRIPFKSKEASPKFAFVEKGIRKKCEREQLQGWQCADCEKYYRNIKGLSDEEIKKRLNSCSRHRSRHNPQALLTPPGFWDPDFTLTQIEQ